MNYEHKIKLENENKDITKSLKVVSNDKKLVFGVMYVNYVYNNNEADAHYKVFVKPAINREAESFKKYTFQFTYDNFKTTIMNGGTPNFLFDKPTPFTALKIPYDKVVDNKIDIGVRTTIEDKNYIAFASIDLTPIYEGDNFSNFVYGDRPKMIKEDTLDTVVVRSSLAKNKITMTQKNIDEKGYSPEFTFHNEIKYVPPIHGQHDDVAWNTIIEPVKSATEALGSGAILNKDKLNVTIDSDEDKFEEKFDDVLKFNVVQKGKDTIFKSNFSTRYDDEKGKVINDELNGKKYIVKNPKAKMNSSIKYNIQIGTINYSAIAGIKYDSELETMLISKATGVLNEEVKYVWNRAEVSNLDFKDDRKMKDVIENAKKEIT